MDSIEVSFMKILERSPALLYCDTNKVRKGHCNRG